jgi:hypothetical protein
MRDIVLVVLKFSEHLLLVQKGFSEKRHQDLLRLLRIGSEFYFFLFALLRGITVPPPFNASR